MNLNQVTVPCTDYEASVAFYRQLGFQQIVANPPRYARFECENGATFSLELSAAPVPVGSTAIVYFEVDDLDDTVEHLRDQGIHFEMGPTDRPWLWREAHLSDPAGNRLCLYVAGNNRRFPPWRLA